MKKLADLDARFREGLLWLMATAAGSVIVAWALAFLVLEAVTLPDLEATAFVSFLSGLALVAFGAAFVPFGVSLRLIGAGITNAPPRPILLRARW